MKLVYEMEWPEVEAKWEKGEKELWQDFYQKKGFMNWRDWRWARSQLLKLSEQKWRMEKTDNLIEEVAQMYCDASTRWTDFYSQREDSTFGVLRHHPFMSSNQKIQHLQDHFPAWSQMIGLRNQGKIIVIDGHHRAITIAGMDKNDYPLPDVNFAISDISDELFEKLYSGGIKLKLERRVRDGLGLIRGKLLQVLKPVNNFING